MKDYSFNEVLSSKSSPEYTRTQLFVYAVESCLRKKSIMGLDRQMQALTFALDWKKPAL